MCIGYGVVMKAELSSTYGQVGECVCGEALIYME